jgi:hypothetical protein
MKHLQITNQTIIKMYCILGLVLILVAVYLESNRKMDQLFYALALLAILRGYPILIRFDLEACFMSAIN